MEEDSQSSDTEELTTPGEAWRTCNPSAEWAAAGRSHILAQGESHSEPTVSLGCRISVVMLTTELERWFSSLRLHTVLAGL